MVVMFLIKVKTICLQFNYLFTNALEVTVKLSCCKFPQSSRLLDEWDNNFESLLAFIEQAQRGIKGIALSDDGR
jgi:hypothetical protein